MIESVAVTLFPAVFLVILFGGGAMLRRQKIDMDGVAPIHHGLFASSKYAIMVLWAVTVVRTWHVAIPLSAESAVLRHVALTFWFFGFSLLFIGRLGLGNSFRIGSAKEDTRLKTGGLFAISRNPMYVGVYATLLGSVLYTVNPIVLVIAVYIIAVHHKIVLAEEAHLRQVFGQEYTDYCCRVRRYL